MIELANKRNKRALIILAVVAGFIVISDCAIGPWLDDWEEVRASLAIGQGKLDLISAVHSPTKQKELAEVVPAFEMPQGEDEQRLQFEVKVNEQLQKAGINVTNLQYVGGAKKQPGLSVKLLRLKCQGKGKFDQIMDMLTRLNENPGFVSIEEMKIECGKEKREEMEMTLMVSTFVQ